MPLASSPNTLAVAQAIKSYMQALTYSGGASVYTLVQLSQIKDVTDQVAAAGSACLEIYANEDDAQHFAFGGVIKDEQSWYLLSMVNMDDSQAAEQLIYQVRDALVVPLNQHIRLGGAGNIFFERIKPGSGKFFDLDRNGQFLRAHVIEVLTSSQWQVTLAD